MRFYDLLIGLWYEARGLCVPRVGSETFGARLAEVLKAMVPTSEIVESAGIDLKREWTPSLEQEMIDAHVAHLLGKWQPAHNSLQDVRPGRQYRSLHWKAMWASRAYGETVVTYIEYRRIFLSPQFGTNIHLQVLARKRRDGRQWDTLARKHARALLDELYGIKAKEPQTFGLLVPSDAMLESVEQIAAEIEECLPFGSVASFEF